MPLSDAAILGMVMFFLKWENTISTGEMALTLYFISRSEISSNYEAFDHKIWGYCGNVISIHNGTAPPSVPNPEIFLIN